MLSGVISRLAALLPRAARFSGQYLFRPLLDYLRLVSGMSVSISVLYAVTTFLAISAPAWLLYSRKREKKSLLSPRNPARDPLETLTLRPSLDDEFFSEYEDEIDIFSDAEYAEEIQIHEAMLASLSSCDFANRASSSVERPCSDTKMPEFDTKVENASHSFCGICLENKESWEMFVNEKCSHSFCYDCTTNHIIAKIQDKVKAVCCPALNCKAALDDDACRLMIPKQALIEWDESVCLSMIPESQKLYCPFLDCSALLVNDSGEVLWRINCPICRRSFCGQCRVPWHSEFTCMEFQKFYVRKGAKDDAIIKKLAEKRNWQKCPKCKIYVEKTEGCLHITCRCKYEFCYRCGSKWRDDHGPCQQKKYSRGNLGI